MSAGQRAGCRMGYKKGRALAYDREGNIRDVAITQELRERWGEAVASGRTTPAEAARACGVSVRTIGRWARCTGGARKGREDRSCGPTGA